ncbi:MAG: hypothetical protein LBU24_04535 [Methanocalculaceae archaeon]|nr:hypothetical protein [Methanocalculaceae archaeon]
MRVLSLYHQYSHPIHGEGISKIIRHNPETVRNFLKLLGFADCVPEAKGC